MIGRILCLLSLHDELWTPLGGRPGFVVVCRRVGCRHSRYERGV